MICKIFLENYSFISLLSFYLYPHFFWEVRSFLNDKSVIYVSLFSDV